MPELSGRTKKQISKLSIHAKHIFKKSYDNAQKEYRNTSKRRGGKNQGVEQVAHKVAWSAVKKKYKKKGDSWVRK